MGLQESCANRPFAQCPCSTTNWQYWYLASVLHGPLGTNIFHTNVIISPSRNYLCTALKRNNQLLRKTRCSVNNLPSTTTTYQTSIFLMTDLHSTAQLHNHHTCTLYAKTYGHNSNQPIIFAHCKHTEQSCMITNIHVKTTNIQ